LCNSGTCRIYGNDNSEDLIVFNIDNKLNRLTEINITNSGGKVSNLTYEYGVNVEIVAPENVQKLSIDQYM